MGAALAVAVGLGIYPDMDAVDELIKVKRRFEPQEAAQAVYERMYPTFRQFYAAWPRSTGQARRTTEPSRHPPAVTTRTPRVVCFVSDSSLVSPKVSALDRSPPSRASITWAEPWGAACAASVLFSQSL